MSRNRGGGAWRVHNEWSQHRYTRVELWLATTAGGIWWDKDGVRRGGAQYVRDLDVVSGSINWDVANFVSSSMDITVTTGPSGPATYTDAHGMQIKPGADFDNLTPDDIIPAAESYWHIPIENSWLVVYAGIKYGGPLYDGTTTEDEQRLGVFRITGITPAMNAGQTDIHADDGLIHLTDSIITSEELKSAIYYGYINTDVPWISTANAVILRGWQSRSVEVADFHAAVSHTMLLAKDTNFLNQPRDQLLQEWATAADGRFYMNSDGRICLRPLNIVWSDVPNNIYTYLGIFGTEEWPTNMQNNPYNSPYQDDTEMTAIVELTQEFDRQQMYNAVLVEWENPNADAASYDFQRRGYAEDNSPNSPTYASGPFGRRVLVVQDVPVASNAEAVNVANRHLQHALARRQQVTMKVPAYPSPEIGDFLQINAPGFRDPFGAFAYPEFFVQSIEYPLGPNSLMTLGLKQH